jgi:hypothetical protein
VGTDAERSRYQGGEVVTTWRAYESTPRKPRPDHKEPPFTTARTKAIHDSLSDEVREEIHAAAQAYAVAVMARFERERGRR